jgi:hypothetical protein
MTKVKTKSFSRSLLKGTVLNLGLQLANRNLNKNNVWQTLLVGAAGGFGDYFLGNAAMGAIIGSGNALVNKTKDFETAAKYAAIGGAADLLLNVAEAKAEESPDDKWIIEWDAQLPNGKLKRIVQEDYEYGCTQATLKSIADYFGKKITNEGKRGGYDFAVFAKMNGFNTIPLFYGDYATETNKIIYKSTEEFYTSIAGYLQRGWPIAATYFNGEKDHTIGVWRIIKKRHTIKTNKIRYDIKITDPAKIDYLTSLPSEKFETAVIRAVKPI